MNEAVQVPLRTNFLLSTQWKAIKLFVVVKISKYRFDRRQSSAVLFTPFFAINALLHCLSISHRGGLIFMEDHYLPHWCLIGRAQTLL